MKNITASRKGVRTIDKIITFVSCEYGAPMGRPNIDNRKTYTHKGITYAQLSGKLYDCAVPMSGDGAYDRGGAYWGIGKQLRVQYTKDLSYVRFYRLGDKDIL